jgi:peptidoglycan-associated lipoprotein
MAMIRAEKPRGKKMTLNKPEFILKRIIMCACVIFAAGCASKGARGGGEADDAVAGSGIGDTSRFYGEHVSADKEAELLSQDTYYFGYNLYDLTPEDRLSIYAHAKKMIEHPGMKARIEAHTDERGSREYNVALGERRAKAVANTLMMKGVPHNQIRTVSYGKEKPAALGHDEASWKENRRAIIVYEGE